MIRWYSWIRLKETDQLGFVCDFDEDVCGELDDPSCVREIELFNGGAPREMWERIECFTAELEEVEEAAKETRHKVCANFDYMRIKNHWTENTPLDRHYSIWIVVEDGCATVWLERGMNGPVEHLTDLSATGVAALRTALSDVGLHGWKRNYRPQEWYIGGNAWGIEVICGSKKVSTGGVDAYNMRIRELCETLNGLGLPVEYWKEHGLIYSPDKKAKKRKKVQAKA